MSSTFYFLVLLVVLSATVLVTGALQNRKFITWYEWAAIIVGTVSLAAMFASI